MEKRADNGKGIGSRPGRYVMNERNQYIRNKAIEEGQFRGIFYWISPGPLEGLNGYALFEKRPVKELGYGGVLNYVPVHGGITYAEENEDKSIVYGFDTAHHDSHTKPREDLEWIRKQCFVMIKGIQKASEIEKKYLRCISQKGKAKYADMLLDLQREEGLNFGTMINILSGQL